MTPASCFWPRRRQGMCIGQPSVGGCPPHIRQRPRDQHAKGWERNDISTLARGAMPAIVAIRKGGKPQSRRRAWDPRSKKQGGGVSGYSLGRDCSLARSVATVNFPIVASSVSTTDGLQPQERDGAMAHGRPQTPPGGLFPSPPRSRPERLTTRASDRRC